MGIHIKLRTKLSQLLFLACAVLLLYLLGCSIPGRGGNSEPPEDPWGIITIPKDTGAKISLVTAITGPYSTMGKGMVNAAKMAIGEHKSSAGLIYELVEEDDICRPDRALPIARSLATQSGYVGVIGHMCVEATKAAVPAYTAAKMVLLSPASTSPQITSLNSPVVFRTSWNDLIQAKTAAVYAHNSLNLKSAAVIHDATPYGSSLAEGFQRAYADMGGAIALSRGVKFTDGADSSLRELTTAMGASSPSLIYFAGLGKNAAILVKALREAGLTTTFMGPDSLNSKGGFINVAGATSEGVYVTQLSLPGSEKSEVWETRYRKQFKTEIPDLGFERQTYDAVMVLLSAADRVAAKQRDGSLAIGRKALADAVKSTEYEGISGRIAFTDSGDRSGVVVEVAKIVQGEVKKVD